MLHPTLGNSTDLDHWADRIVSRSEVPRLLRRLVHATCQQVEQIGFPADEGVQLGGWDGIVHTPAGNAYVPPGVSVWETGANINVKGKADDDYEKRSQNPLDVLPDQSTFVFVTPRRWGGKTDWVNARKAEGIWHEVRAYDAEDLTQWLEQAPAVHIWLSELIGKRPAGAISLDDFWATWASETNPVLPPALMIGGRTREQNQVLDWLQALPHPFSLAGDSAGETIAFLASVLQEADAGTRDKNLSRAVVVENAEAWRTLGPSHTPLILIANFADPEGVGKVVQQGHHVFLPLDKAGAGWAAVLPRLVRSAAEQALLASGLSYDRASKLATLARVSLSALRRTIAVAPGLLAPAWARPEAARELLAPLLAGVWQGSAAGDRAALAALAGIPYEDLQPVLTRRVNEPSSALRHTAGIWMVAGRADAWQRLSIYLTEEDLKRFEDTALSVLSEIDSTLDLPPDHRSFGHLFGKAPLHSGYVRQGVAETMAIMAIYSQNDFLAPATTGEHFASRFVRLLLARAKENISLWVSLSRHLPTLAEAAPGVFLDAVSEGLQGDMPALACMFQDKEHSLFASSPHTGLLWALETLAWSSEHFGRAVLCLTQLARLDPGGKMGNRPANSLRDIFLCWHPNTMASLARRLSVLDAMRKREPEVSWHLMMRLMPSVHSTVDPTHRPKWRDWAAEEETRVTVAEYWEATDRILDRVLSDAGASASRWCNLIEAAGEMTPPQRGRLIGRLEALDENLFSSEERATIQDTLRKELRHHQEFPDADWAMPAADTDRLEQVYDRFQPQDPVVKHRWLFQSYVRMPGIRRINWEEREHALKSTRVQALIEVYHSEGWSGPTRLAEHAENAHSLGHSLLQAGLIPGDETGFLREHLTSQNPGRRQMAQSFIYRSYDEKGEPWVQGLLAAMQEWTPEEIASFLLCLPLTPLVLDKLDAATEETRQVYWKTIRSVSLFDDTAQSERLLAAMLAFGRSDLAMEAIERAPKEASKFLTPEQIAEVLEIWTQTAVTLGFDLASVMYISSELLDRLEASDLERERLARLEWNYLPLHRQHRQPRLLHKELASSPKFFIEVLTHAYPILEDLELEEDSQANLEAAARAKMSRALFDNWRQIPGRDEDTVDAEVLQAWVTTVRELAADCDRLKIADDTFGKVFAYSPPDPDEAWPHQAIRDIIEDLASPEVEDAWETEVINRYGSTTRGLTDGGAQERHSASRYEGYARQVEDSHPRVAAALRRLVDYYRGLAVDADQRAELTQDFWN